MRKIDGKHHIEGEQIVKTSNGEVLPEDEPLFLIRARDRLAIPLLVEYLGMSVDDVCTDYHLNGAADALAAFKRFRDEHPERMKQPGITRGA